MLYVRRSLTSESRARPAAFRRASLSNPSAAAASPRESRRPARFEAARSVSVGGGAPGAGPLRLGLGGGAGPLRLPA